MNHFPSLFLCLFQSPSRSFHRMHPRGLSLIEATDIIGRKIERRGLSYGMFPYDEAEKGMAAMGLSADMSRQYIEMSKAFNEGRIKLETLTREIITTTSFRGIFPDSE